MFTFNQKVQFLLSVILFVSGGLFAQATHKVMVPAYFFPYDTADAGTHNVGPKWSTLIDLAATFGDRLVVIANPNNGPGSGKDWEYQKFTEAINKVRSHGAKVVGYIYTCYGLTKDTALCAGRTTADVLQDIANWKSWYNVDGIFLDENSSQVEQLAWYKDLDKAILAKWPDGLIVSNYGTQPAGRYLNRAGAPVMMENTAAHLDSNTSELRNLPPSSVVLIHSMTDRNWRARRNTLKNKGAAYIYVTDDGADMNPWDTIPSFLMKLFE